MFSKTKLVMKNKGKIEKVAKARRKNEINSLKDRSSFRAKLFAELQHIDVALQSPDIDGVIITIPQRYVAMFSEALYSEEMSGYIVEQVEGESSKFIIRRKFINF